MVHMYIKYIMKGSEVAIKNEKDLYVPIQRDFQDLQLSERKQINKEYLQEEKKWHR